MSLNILLCTRCKIKPADFQCDECFQGGVYCSNCDGYLHSLPSKRHHFRTPLHTDDFSQNIPPQQIQTPSPQGITLTQGYLSEIKNIYETEKQNLQATIAQLTNELSSTKKSLGERIDFLHSHLEETNQKHNSEIETINTTHLNEMNNILSDKENQIGQLVAELNHQKALNNEMMIKVNEYQKLLDINSISYSNEINQLSNHLDNLNKENYSLETFYKNKIDEINAMNTNEKNKIISSYEMAIEKLNMGYLQSKEKYTNVIQQREDYIKELVNAHKKEINDLNLVIDKLKECNETSKNDQEELIKMNDTLKQTLEKINEELGTTKRNLKKLEKEKKKMENIIENISNENEELKMSNDKLNGIVYGKFNKTKQN